MMALVRHGPSTRCRGNAGNRGAAERGYSNQATEYTRKIAGV